MQRHIAMIALGALGVWLLVSDGPRAVQAATAKTLWVAHYRTECPGDPERQCYLVKDDHWGSWSPWLSEIEGFDWRPGFAYEIRVREKPVPGSTAEPAAVRLELIEILDRVEAFERLETAAARASIPTGPTPASDPVYRGYLTIGDGLEARAFRLCGDRQSVWVEDGTGELWQTYRAVAGRPNRPVFMTVQGALEPAPASGFGAHYERQLKVTHLLEASTETAGCDAEGERIGPP